MQGSAKKQRCNSFPSQRNQSNHPSRTEGFPGTVPGKMEQLVTLIVTALSRFKSLRKKSKAKFHCFGELRKAHDIPSCSRAVAHIHRNQKKREGEDHRNRVRLRQKRELGRMRNRAGDEKGPSVTDHTSADLH